MQYTTILSCSVGALAWEKPASCSVEVGFKVRYNVGQNVMFYAWSDFGSKFSSKDSNILRSLHLHSRDQRGRGFRLASEVC